MALSCARRTLHAGLRRTKATMASNVAAPLRIAVIGSGYAGLAAARRLAEGGCSVTVLEAGTRPGGRACTQRIDEELSLELGATWLHGLGSEAQPNPVFAAGVEAGLCPPEPAVQQWWDSRFLLPGSPAHLTTQQAAAVTRALAAYTDTVEGLSPGSKGSVGDHLDASWQQLVAHSTAGDTVAGSSEGSGSTTAVDLMRRAWQWRERLQRAMDGCHSTHGISAQGLALYDEMEGGLHAPLPCGFQAVAERLAAPLDVRYGHAVLSVRWGPGGVTLTCSNGVVLEADAAIVAVSLGVLKASCLPAESSSGSASAGSAEAGRMQFEPALPARKLEAVSRLQIGIVDKLFVEFPAGPAAAAGARLGEQSAAADSGRDIEQQSRTVSGEQGAGELGEGSVSYALLWDAGDSSPSSSSSSRGGSAQALPAWARGIFSVRFGGPELKLRASSAGQQVPQQQQTAAADAAAHEGACHKNACDGALSSEPLTASARVPGADRQQRCAIIWLTGEEAAAAEAASDAEVLAGLQAVAEHFPGLQLPAGADWQSARLHRSLWGSDPLFRGSYSYLGVDASPADVDALRAPLTAADAMAAAGSSDASAVPNRPVLLFAGDACHIKYIGTTHGAFLTGVEAAEKLLSALAN